MARVIFTPHLRRHIGLTDADAPGGTVREVLEAVFAGHELARGYVLDDQSAVRKHVTIFLGAERIKDRTHLSDPVPENGEIYVLQALSGG